MHDDNLRNGARAVGHRADSGIYRIDIVLCVVALVNYFLLYKLSSLTWNDLFWDFDVYQRAVTDVELGADPYRRDAGSPFVYHPAILFLFVWLDRTVGLANAFLGLCAAAVLIFLWGYRNAVLPGLQTPSRAGAALGAKAFALAVAFSITNNLGALFTGNVTLYLHLALIGSVLIYLQRRSDWRQLLVLTVFSCALVVKPYFLVYVLPLLLVDRFSLRSVVRVMAAVLAASAIYLLFWMFFRPHSLRFVQALHDLASASRDLSDSSLGLLLRFLPMHDALLLHAAMAMVCVLLVVFIRRISAAFAGATENDDLLFLLAYVLVTLCSPRMKDYDLAPAFICFYLYLFCQGLFGRAIILLSLLIVQVPLFAVQYFGRPDTPEVFSASNLWVMAGLLLPLAIFLGGKACVATAGKRTPVVVA